MILAHRIRLVPTADQESYFARACGVARFAYNWALAEWQRQYAAGEKPSEAALRQLLRGSQEVPTQRASLEACEGPDVQEEGSPRQLRADNGPDTYHPDAVRTNGKRVDLPIIGWVAMREEVRFAGRILSATISREADAWYASFAIEMEHEPNVRIDDSVVGVDVGITALATLSEGSKIAAPEATLSPTDGSHPRNSARRAARRTSFSRSPSALGRAYRATRPTTAMSMRRATSHDTRRVHPRQPVEPKALAARRTSR